MEGRHLQNAGTNGTQSACGMQLVPVLSGACGRCIHVFAAHPILRCQDVDGGQEGVSASDLRGEAVTHAVMLPRAVFMDYAYCLAAGRG